MNPTAISLDDKYTALTGRVYLTGIQALVRLPISQHLKDQAAGLNTAGYICGYRGSPLSGYDSEILKNRELLEPNHIYFDPGLNEELGATAVWGSQQVGIFGKPKYDGVHSIWYGKNPGLDRSGDALKHGNFNGSARHGGVLCVVGDDHAAKSATMPNQGEFAFMSFLMPVLYPSNVQEVIDFGLYGWAMSRFSGCWVGFKVLPQLMDASASVSVDPERTPIILPEFAFPPDGVNIRWPDDRFTPEARLLDFKLPAAQAFARANTIDRVAFGQASAQGPGRRFGIVTAGKSFHDVRQALEELGIDERRANQLGISVLKLGLTWPIDPVGAKAFCEDRAEILVVEEKQPIIQDQLRAMLYHLPESRRPRVVGQTDQEGRPVLSAKMDLDPLEVAHAIARRLLAMTSDSELTDALARIEEQLARPSWSKTKLQRVPYFCSGCPHSSSIPRPMDSREMGGIGCHWMAVWHPEFDLEPSTQMGGEGANWVGQSHFTETDHVFQNLGDGTYYHSGYLAIRWAISVGVNITYKILYNDASAMTGGQPVEGHPTVAMITNQLHGEGVRRIAVVSDEPGKYPMNIGFAPGVTIHHRDEMEALQIALRAVKGVSVLIYDQTCAAEKRRRRKRGAMVEPTARLFINDLVCEGCGDCSAQSNCISVEPVETEFGRKRHINQSSCNKDYSCKSGFCPSFVTVEGAKLKKHKARENVAELVKRLPRPVAPDLDRPYNLVVTGIGGTGVITVGALLGMAAHIEGKGCSVLDSIGLAQKNGAVLSYVRVGRTPEDLHTARIPLGQADCLIACDMVVAAGPESMVALARGRTRGVVNGNVTPTAAFVLDPDVDTDTGELSGRLLRALGKESLDVIDAQELSTRLLGDGIGQNVMLMGAAYQKGLLPVGLEALDRAIAINGVGVRMNRDAFAWGRLAAHDPAMVEMIAGLRADRKTPPAETLEAMVARRAAFLTDYQNAAYAARYEALVDATAKAEQAAMPGATALSKAVARYYFKLMAYKDEYEVARLHTDPAFMDKLRAEFEDGFTLSFNLAPPIMAKPDPVSGEPTKRRFGPWVVPLFKSLRALKGLRGTAFDIFGYSAERKLERRLITEYAARMRGLIARLTPANYDIAVEIASVPERIRGYGYIKRRHLAQVIPKQAELLAAFDVARPEVAAAE